MLSEDPGVTWPAGNRPVQLVDCSQPWNADTPPFPADEPPTVVWAKRLSSHGTNHQRISTQLHIGTHIDAPLHWREEGMDIASIPLERLYGPVVVADISDLVSDFHVTDNLHRLQPVLLGRLGAGSDPVFLQAPRGRRGAGRLASRKANPVARHGQLLPRPSDELEHPRLVAASVRGSRKSDGNVTEREISGKRSDDLPCTAISGQHPDRRES